MQHQKTLRCVCSAAQVTFPIPTQIHKQLRLASGCVFKSVHYGMNFKQLCTGPRTIFEVSCLSRNHTDVNV